MLPKADGDRSMSKTSADGDRSMSKTMTEDSDCTTQTSRTISLKA